MASITVNTTREEQDIVLATIKNFQGQTLAVSAIAAHAGLPQSRVRYVITDLLEAKKIRRESTKAFNEHYIRYKYFVV